MDIRLRFKATMTRNSFPSESANFAHTALFFGKNELPLQRRKTMASKMLRSAL